MEDNTTTVDGYTMGGLGMAVGTSLIFESWRESPEKIKKYIDTVDQFRVNLHTLVRNISEALEDEVRSVDSIVSYFTIELPLFETAVMEFFPNATIVYYVTDMKYYKRVIPRTTLRVSKSDRIRKLSHIEHTATGDCYELLELAESSVIERVTAKQGHIANTAMVLTHLPADLLCHMYYKDMFLVESHTGTVREKDTFTHKILPRHRRDDAHVIPFNHLSFYVYGDGGKMLQQASGAITTRYTNLAKASKWHRGTSTDKVVSDINKARDEKLIDWFAR